MSAGGPSITARLGLDSGEFDRQLKQAEKRQKDAAKAMAAANEEVEDSMRKIAAAQREELELAKLRAKLAGENAVAEALEEEIKLKDESVRLSQKLGVAEHEAYAMAQERLALEKKLAAATATEARTKAVEANVKANESLLETDNKVEGQLVGLTGNLLRAESAGEATASAISAVGESLNLSLGTAAGIGVVATLTQAFAETETAMKAFNEELRDLNQEQGSANYRGLSELETRLGKLKEKLQELEKPPGTLQYIAEGLDELGGFVDETGDQRRTRQANDTRSAIEQTKADIASKQAAQNKIHELEQDGEKRQAELAKVRLKYEEQIGQAIRDGNVALQEQLKKAQELDEKDVNDQFDKEIQQVRSAVADEAAGQYFDGDRQARKNEQEAIESEKEARAQKKEEEKQIRDITNEAAYVRAQSEIDATAETSKRLALQQKAALIDRQIADQRAVLNDESDDIKRETIKKNIVQLEAQHNAVLRDQATLEDDLSRQQEQTANKAEQAAVDQLKAVDAVKGAKAQILLIEKEIAQLEALKAKGDEKQAGEIDQQIVGLNAQKQQEINTLARRRLMSPDQRRAEDRAGNTIARAQRAAATSLSEAAKTKAQNEIELPEFAKKWADESTDASKDPNVPTDWAKTFGSKTADPRKSEFPKRGEPEVLGPPMPKPFKSRAGVADAMADAGVNKGGAGGKTLSDVYTAITELKTTVAGLNFVTPPAGAGKK